MRRLLLVSAATAGFLLLLCAPQARADGTTDTFVFSSASTLTVEWQLPAWPHVDGNYVSGVDALELNANDGLIPATLTVTTPEPSSLLLLLVGFLVVLGTMAVKKLQV